MGENRQGGLTPRTDADEIAHYDKTTQTPESVSALSAKVADARASCSGEQLPLQAWLETRFDSVAQEQSVRHILPLVPDGRVVQVGGTGLTALKALIGGASQAVLVTPSQGELDLTRQVAAEFGLEERLVTIAAYGERMPIEDGSVDVVVSDASMHHTNVVEAMAEVHRVLRVGGRFGCFEPWRAPLYGVGTRVLGKRDPGVQCRPLDAARVKGLDEAFPGAEIAWHGAFTRYLMIGLSKLGLGVPRSVAHRVTVVDDAIARWVPSTRRLASSVSITATKR